MSKKEVGSLFVKLGLVTSEFDKAIANAQKSFRRVGRQFESVGSDLTKGVSLPIAAAAGAALKFSIDFNKSMANVASLIPGNSERIIELKKNIQDLAVETGTSTQQLSDGLYQVISAFGDSAETAALLRTSAQSAKAGVAETTDAINLLSAVTKGYGDTSAIAVQKASDLALLTVRLGQTTFPELAASIGKVVPLSQALKVSQEEMFAVMATATGVTGQASEVSTQFRGVLQALLAPTGEMTKLFEDLGVKSGEALIQQKGLGESLRLVGQYATDQDIPLQKLIGSIEGQTIALALNGSLSDQYKTKLEQMGQSAGTTQAAFNEITNGTNNFGFALEQLQQKGVTALQKLGDEIIKAVGADAIASITKLGDFLLSLVDKFAALDPKTKEFIVKFTLITAAIGPVLIGVGALATVLGGALLIKVTAVTLVMGALIAKTSTYGVELKKINPTIDLAVTSFGRLVTFLNGQFPQTFKKAESVINNFKTNFSESLVKIKDAFLDLPNKIGNAFDKIFIHLDNFSRKIKSALVDTLKGSIDSANKMVDSLTTSFFNMYDKVVGNSYVPDMVEEIGREFVVMERGMVGNAERATNTVSGLFRDLLNDTDGIFTDMGNGAFSQLGQGLEQTLASSITEAFNSGDVSASIERFTVSAAGQVGAAFGGPLGQAIAEIGAQSTINSIKAISSGKEVSDKDMYGTAFATGGLSLIPQLAFNAFNNKSPEEEARKKIELFLEETLGRNVVFGQFTENFSTAFDEMAGTGRGAFETLGTYLTDFLGVGEDVGSQIGFILSQNLNGNLDEARILVQELGLNAQDLETHFVEMGKAGELSWHAVEVSLQGVNALTAEGLVGVGDMIGAYNQLIASGGSGQRTLIALRNIGIEAGEAGASGIQGIRDGLIAAGESTENADRILQAFSGRGINSLQDLAGASDRVLGGVAADLESLGIEWGSLTEGVDDSIASLDKLDKKLKNLSNEVDLKVNVSYENKNNPDGVVANAMGNIFESSGIKKFAKGGVFGDTTYFRHAGGQGMLGEAGPESIMPLKRMKDGSLGVIAEMQNQNSGSVVYNIDARGAQAGVEVAILAAMKQVHKQAVTDSINITQDLIRRGAL